MLLLHVRRRPAKRESTKRSLGRSSRQRALPVLQPRGGKLGHQAPAIQRRECNTGTKGGIGFPDLLLSDFAWPLSPWREVLGETAGKTPREYLEPRIWRT